ncbi:MAG: metallopeptidase family protein [Mariprofundus sp.]|nr:metallopeptidase family protein [Mariprofundus sp.]
MSIRLRKRHGDFEKHDCDESHAMATIGMMNAEEFRLTAEKALNVLPDRFRLAMENVVVVTEEFADDDVLRKMHVDSPYDLLGLYEGVSLIERSTSDSGALPDMIYLYRRPILAVCRDSGQSPDQCIAEVLMHEIGHYFGFSDAEMARIEQLTGHHNVE